MKEKRYFLDWMKKPITKKEKSLLLLVTLIVLIISVIISITTSYEKFLGTINESYPTAEYEYLEKIIDESVKKGENIDTSIIVGDIITYKITEDNDKINYYLRYNNTEANITVVLSKDYEILSEERNYKSEEEYLKAIKFTKVVLIILIPVLIMSVILFVIYGFTMIALTISFIHKKIDGAR